MNATTTESRRSKPSRDSRRSSKARLSRIAVTGATVSAVLALTGALGRQASSLATSPSSTVGNASTTAIETGLATRTLTSPLSATPAATVTRLSVAVTRSGGSR